MKEKKLTVIGTMDPVSVVSKLRKYWPTADLVTVGPAKEPEKKEEAKKEEPKKEEPKKEEEPPKKEESPPAKKEEEAKKEEPKKEGDAKKEEEKKIDPVMELVKAYRAYNPHMTTQYYVQSIEENPNACVIF